jgi:hypothetical protein
MLALCDVHLINLVFMADRMLLVVKDELILHGREEVLTFFYNKKWIA